MVELDAPSVDVPDIGCMAKLALFWETNKCLAITILVVLSLIFFGIIFCIVWFLILGKGSSDDAAAVDATASTAHAAVHLAGLSLRRITA